MNRNRYEPEPGFKDLGLNRTEPNRTVGLMLDGLLVHAPDVGLPQIQYKTAGGPGGRHGKTLENKTAFPRSDPIIRFGSVRFQPRSLNPGSGSYRFRFVPV